MKTTVTTIAPVLLPFLFAFAPSTGFASYARHPIERSSNPTFNSVGTDGSRLRETTVSLDVETKTRTQTASSFLKMDFPRLASWLEKVVIKISTYDDVVDGWKGEGSLAPLDCTLDDAKELAAQFATEMPSIVCPSISADEDGSVCFYWLNGEMMATVSIHGDGTYAFYAEGYDDAVRSDSELVGTPLPAALIAAMSGPSVSAVIAA